MIWIEHHVQMVADLADRIHALDHGRTLAEGAPEIVSKDPRVIEAYLGRRSAVGVRPAVLSAAPVESRSARRVAPWTRAC
ncbi:MAG: hypothetical protein ACLPKB_31135 [Xanthobacteraceae bacterium]